MNNLIHLAYFSNRLKRCLLFSSVPSKWVTAPGDAEAMEGGFASLDCLVSGVPRPVVTWAKADAVRPGRYNDVFSVMNNFR